MKRLGLVLPAVISFLLLSVSVGALDLLDSQREITLIIEQGGSAEFMLLMFNTESDDVLFPDGDIEDWITFGEGHLAMYELDNRGIDWVKITIDVPPNTEVGEYEGSILSSHDYSDIIVRVIPPADEIKSMQDLENVKEELQTMTESIGIELNNTRRELKNRIAEISQYQQNLTKLEAELERLREKSQELEKANTQLTGQIVGGAPTQFIMGMVIGIIVVVLFLCRRGIARAIRDARRSGGGAEEKYRGWKPNF